MLFKLVLELEVAFVFTFEGTKTFFYVTTATVKSCSAA